MERKGYVERIPNPKDRRSALVRETEAGLRDSLEHLWPYIEEMRSIEGGFLRGTGDHRPVCVGRHGGDAPARETARRS